MNDVTVYRARKVITMDAGRPFASCIAVMDGRVLSTGTIESMQPWLKRYPHKIDDTFADKVIMPGLIDPHTHFAFSAGYLAMHYIGPIDSPGPAGINPGLPTRPEVIAKLREADKSDPDSTAPLIAWGLDPASQGGHLHRDELDQVSTTRPIWVISYAPHFTYLNSAALVRAKVPDNSNVHGVMRYPDGRLNGQFVELEAGRVALGAMRDAIAERGGAEGLRRMGDIARKAGVTTTAEMIFGKGSFENEWQLHAKVVPDDSYPVRMGLVSLEMSLYADHGSKSVDFLLEAMKRSNDKLFFHGVKFLSDGSFPAMSLRLNFPGYLDGSNGLRNDVPWDELHERMLPFWKAGIQIHCHANGDEAVDASLNALAKLQNIQPKFDHRFTLEHYCISTPDQARRLKALGGVASVNNYFVHYRSQLHSEEGFGPDRSEAVARLGSLEREGVIFALHSDYSLVLVPLHPLTAAWVAVNRIALDGKTVLAPGERISVERALRAITIDAAYVLGAEQRLGSLEPGKLADFAILESDPFEVDPMDLKDIKIWGTVLSGRIQPA
jgi:predicted amidohydrolase YtcJ